MKRINWDALFDKTGFTGLGLILYIAFFLLFVINAESTKFLNITISGVSFVLFFMLFGINVYIKTKD